MKIDLFTFCEYATNTAGELTIVKTVDNFYAERFPWRVYFGFAIKGRIINNPDKNTIISLRIYKKDEPANDIFATESPIMENPGRFAMAGNLRGLIFSVPGTYIFKIDNNQGSIHEYEFSVEIEPQRNADTE